MPTPLTGGSGGVGVSPVASRWHGTGGKRGKESFAPEVGSPESAEARTLCGVAIARLPYEGTIFAFCSLVKDISLYPCLRLEVVLLSNPLLAPNPSECACLLARYTRISRSKAGTVGSIGILIIDDDAASQAAFQQVLGAEGWLVEGATSNAQALQQLATGRWTLVIANTVTTGVTGALFSTLKELAQPPESEAAKTHVRILFIVPEAGATHAAPLLEQEHLPYIVKPFTFHDLLERVSDLLMETEAIGAPLRNVKQEGLKSTRRSRHAGRDPGRDGARNTGMFSGREDYQWSEEELAEYERQETETLRKKKKKPLTLG
jgi:DNA-binding response OmpR family regulator